PDESMGGTGRQPEPPGDQIPHDRPDQSAKNDIRRDDLQVDHPAADRLRYAGSEYERRDEIEECGPDHSLTGSQNTRSNNGRHRIGSIVKPVDVVENECDQDDRGYEY